MIRKIKTWIFNNKFERIYNGLILGELYPQKVKLLNKMKKNKDEYLKKYLKNGISLTKQLDAELNSL